MRRGILVALAACCSCARPTVRADDARAGSLVLRDEIPKSSQAFDHLRDLVDAAGPRLSGSAGDARARAWALERMRQVGLSNVRAEPVAVPSWRRLREEAELVAPFSRKLAITALGGSVATPAEGVEATLVRFAAEDTLRRAPDGSARGKIVFIDVPMPKRADGTGYRDTVWARGDGVREAARLGALAVVIRSVGTDGDRLPHTGQTRYAPDGPKIPAAAVANPDADFIARALERGVVTLRLVLDTSSSGPVDGANIVGELPGDATPEEIVLFGAHLDSWDLGDGALDDGAGCAIVLETARQLSTRKLRTARTIRFVLFANEENGLAGAFAYAKAHEGELARHVVGIEADSGDGKPRALRVHGDRATRVAFDTLVPLLAPLGVVVDPDPAEGGADLIPLKRAGIPVIDLLQDETRYFDVHHTANDVLSKVVVADLDAATAGFATLVHAAATTKSPLRTTTP